jgi:hypothetical protein
MDARAYPRERGGLLIQPDIESSPRQQAGRRGATQTGTDDRNYWFPVHVSLTLWNEDERLQR